MLDDPLGEIVLSHLRIATSVHLSISAHRGNVNEGAFWVTGFGLDSSSSLDFSGTLNFFCCVCILLCPLLGTCLMVISVSCLFIWEVVTVSLLHAVGNGVRTGPGTQ